MYVEYKCRSRIHAIKKDFPCGDGRVSYLEVRCKDKWCGDRINGEVVFHYFDIETGILHHTKKYKEPHR